MSTPAPGDAQDGAREHTFVVHDPWSRMLFLALARNHGLVPYRRKAQRSSTIRIRVSHAFIEHMLWPHFQAADRVLQRALCEVTQAIVADTLRGDRNDGVTPLHRRRAP